MKILIKLSASSVLALTVILFTGCDEFVEVKDKNQKIITQSVLMTNGVNTYCDKSNNVEYLIYQGYRSAGMTVRYGQDGKIKNCKRTY